MSWGSGLSADLLSTLLYAAPLLAALIGVVLTVIAIRERRAREQRRWSAINEEAFELESEETTDPDERDGAPPPVSVSRDIELNLEQMPAFSSVPAPGGEIGLVGVPEEAPESDNPGDVSTLLFSLLGTKARICELERAEQSKSRVLESTDQALERLKGSMSELAPALLEEIDEMHDLISVELTASRQSLDSAQELKTIIDSQYELLEHSGSTHTPEFLRAKQAYVDTIDASLDRRLEAARKRETEFALGKERLMALRGQMLELTDAQADGPPMRREIRGKGP